MVGTRWTMTESRASRSVSCDNAHQGATRIRGCGAGVCCQCVAYLCMQVCIWLLVDHVPRMQLPIRPQCHNTTEALG